MTDYWFFLSYARRDAKGDPWLKQFYGRLALEVGKAAGLPSRIKENDIGFFDEEGIETGDEWPSKLGEALQTSQVFVCLYSNSYFKSEYCGKEFQVFQSRLDAHTREHNSPVTKRILPILWDRPIRIPEELPEAVSGIQYSHADLGEMYAEHGLAYIIRTKQEAAYEEFIIKFAEQIVKSGGKYELPPLHYFPSIKNVMSAFHATTPIVAVPSSPTGLPPRRLPPSAALPRIAGPDVAWYVYFAGRQVDYKGIRSKLECYGNLDGREWQPHLPPTNKKVGVITPTVALEKNIMTDVLTLSEDLINNLREAENTNTIAVLIVDPWSVKFESYRALMNNYDRRRFSNCGVIIVWNTNDDETMLKRNELRAEIESTFPRNLEANDIFFRDAVHTEDELRAELSAVIEKVRERLMKRAKPVRPIPSGDDLFPSISGQ